MIILCLLCFVAGYAVADNMLGTRIRTITVQTGDAFYQEPSLAAASSTDLFKVDEELLVIDKLELDKPTAVVMQKNLLLENKEHVKYKLVADAVYKLAEANLAKPAAPCVIEVQTVAGNTVQLEVPKEAVRPINEGTWLRVRQKHGKQEAWKLSSTKWY